MFSWNKLSDIEEGKMQSSKKKMSNLISDKMEESTRQEYFPDLYFKNVNKRIDYILVYNNNTVMRRRYFKSVMEYFVNSLSGLHIEYEISPSTKDTDMIYLKMHVPRDVLEEYADIHYIELNYKSKSPHIGKPIHWLPCFYDVLSFSDRDSEVTGRAMESVLMLKPKRLIQAERVLLAHIILSEVRFGRGINEFGIERLVDTGAAIDAFPLHEGPTNWTTEGPLTDRQLLRRYWCGLKNMYKMQPLKLIEKYFGPQMAFFYAFLQLTNGMMMVASVLGIFFFLLGILFLSDAAYSMRDYICNSDKILCPFCNPKHCHPRTLKSFCGMRYSLNQYFDNLQMVILGICITLWGTVFLEMWGKRQTLYQIEWNLTSLETDIEMRTGYERRATLLVRSPITNQLEPTMSPVDAKMRILISSSAVLLLIFMVFGSEVLVIMMKMHMKIWIHENVESEMVLRNLEFVLSIFASTVTVLVILSIDMVYRHAAKFLTDWENPRTQRQYDNSFLLKCFLFAFANNYTMVLYIAFFKGRFYTNPGDQAMYDFKGGFFSDRCTPDGCNVDLAIQVMFILGVKHLFVKCIGKYFIKVFHVMWKKYKEKQRSEDIKTPQWENDYILKPFERYDIMNQYTEIILRHGYVLFFSSVCPFTPILTLLVNMFEMKLYSYAYTNLYRRPIPRKVEGIEIWYYILATMTWFGVTVNALLALMTKDFAMMHYYLYKVGANLTEFMDHKFAAFAVEDFKQNYHPVSQNYTVCYFLGYRYPPGHPRKYEVNTDIYQIHAFGWTMVVAYLHIVFLLTRLIAYFIPNTYSEVKDYLNDLHSEEQKEIRKFRNHQYTSERRLKPPVSFQTTIQDEPENEENDTEENEENM